VLECTYAGSDANHLGVDVPTDHLRHSRVRENDLVHRLDAHAGVVQLDARKDDPFLEDIDGVRAVGVLRSHVLPMSLDRRVADELLVDEGGRDDTRVLLVAARDIGDIDEDDVAGPPRL
jgi:hypothetical protein